MDGVNGLEKKEMNSKKLKVLCLHGFRTSGSFLRKQIGKWDPSIFQDFHLDFPDGIFLAGGKSDIEDIYPPPYFEWFQFNKDFTEYTNLEECILYLCDYMTKNGPFDGMLGFSQIRRDPAGWPERGEKMINSGEGGKYREAVGDDPRRKKRKDHWRFFIPSCED